MIKYIIAGNLVDGTGAPVRRNIYLKIENDIITDIAPVQDMPTDTNGEIINLSACTIVPPLVDCCVSLTNSPAIDATGNAVDKEPNPLQLEALVKKHIHFCHTHGVLGAAVLEDTPTSIRKYLNNTDLSRTITIRLPQADLDKQQQTKDLVKIDFTKVNYSPDIEEKQSVPQLSQKQLCNIVKSTNTHKFVVRANGQQAVKEALEAGCDAIEQGYEMGDTNLVKMAENKILWIPSVLRAKNLLDCSADSGNVCCRFSQRFAAPGKADPDAEKYWTKILANQLKQLQKAKQYGVKTAIGTGAGSTGLLHGESVVEEMKIFIKGGFTLEETIQCATKNGALFFNMENLGPLLVGKKATFLVTRGTAKQLPRKLAYLEDIYINGHSSSIYHKNPVKA